MSMIKRALEVVNELGRAERCRMLDRHDNRCTGEVLDPNGEIKICGRHAGLVMELINTRLHKMRH
jgi:hypothetical protein